jgi:peptide/nickel transport system permease protein
MHRYIITRLLLAIPTLAGAAALVFILMRLIPGDVCVIRLGSGGAHVDQDALALCRQNLGLDQPMVVQFLMFLKNYAMFDFGTSMWSGNPVWYEILIRLPVSLEVAILATVIAVLLAIPLGTLSALKENSGLDHVVRVPAITVGYRYSAVTMRLTRSAMLEVMREDYIRTARAKGLLERIVVNRHALKNALLPVVTLIGIEFAFLIGGLVITEQVFNLNGVGRLLVQAVQNQDNVLAQALVMLIVLVFVVVNLVVDVLYAWLDPRIRYS